MQLTRRPSNIGAELDRFLIVLALVTIVLGFGQLVPALFRYERSLVIEGEYWRLVTGHFTHLGWWHLLLNWLGLVLIAQLFISLYSYLYWLISALLCLLAISFGFLFLNPELDWYVGLSGLLHGLFVIGVVGELRKGRWLFGFALLVLVGKLIAENLATLPVDMSRFIGANVVVEAHLYGAISGGLIAVLMMVLNAIWTRRFGDNSR